MTSPRAPRPDQVAVLAPIGRDAVLAVQTLQRWDIQASQCRDMPALIAAVRAGLGVAVIAEEAVLGAARVDLVEALREQASWSDLPIVLLTGEGELSPATAIAVEEIAAHGNITLLERPVRMASLVTTVQAALRARQRQYDVRDHLVALSAARVEAETANRAKVEFLAMMSHELRTPLNAIAGYIDLLELGLHGPITTQQHEVLQRIQRSQRHLLGLINGVLNFARIERGTVSYDVQDVLANDLLASAELLVSPQARAHGLTLVREPCDPGLFLRADVEKAQQILLNLLSNSIKFTAPGGRVTLRCIADDTVVRISIEDTGRGIPPDKLDMIFEPFVQVDSQLTRTSEGVGLGLAISRDLARGMGGDLTATSIVGSGSVFTLTLRQSATRAAA